MHEYTEAFIANPHHYYLLKKKKTVHREASSLNNPKFRIEMVGEKKEQRYEDNTIKILNRNSSNTGAQEEQGQAEEKQRSHCFFEII